MKKVEFETVCKRIYRAESDGLTGIVVTSDELIALYVDTVYQAAEADKEEAYEIITGQFGAITPIVEGTAKGLYESRISKISDEKAYFSLVDDAVEYLDDCGVWRIEGVGDGLTAIIF